MTKNILDLAHDFDALGDAMKLFEGAEAGRRFMPGLPVLARIDGRHFSSFTRGLERPFDERMATAMRETTRQLLVETGAVLGYTQSDEISLCFLPLQSGEVGFFAGRIQKMTSQLAALATVYFYREVESRLPRLYAEKLPTFDARVWAVPTEDVAALTFLWREKDATKNSVSMAAQAYFSHKELQGVGTKDKIEMLAQKGVKWSDYPDFFKRGTYFGRVKTDRPFTAEEIEKLPPKHAARTDPGLVVTRQDVQVRSLPPAGSIANLAGVLFRGETTVLKTGKR